MTVAQLAPAMTRGSSRWLLLGSLALNLFFIGIAAALAIRAPAPSVWDRDVFVRTERLAATLPPADADLLRGRMNAEHDAIEAAQRKYFVARESIHQTLRETSFKPESLRAAMANTRAARQAYDVVIQGVFASAAIEMSPAGRKGLADWPPGRKLIGNSMGNQP
jgi:uncharacterized membrane protein